MSAFLKVTGLEFSYGEVKVLHGLDLEVPAQSISCVMGRNGVGKTTFLRNLVGLEKASAGEVFMEGADLTAAEAFERASRGIGYVPQGRQIFPLLTVAENLSVGLEAAGSSTHSIPEEVYSTFPVLHKMRSRKGGDLSGGQQQRVAIARAVINNPQFLFLDEPTGNLDNKNANLVQDLIIQIADEYKVALILSTHDNSFAQRMDNIYKISNRNIIEV